eukprot:TRINITY_DN4628_c0_g1_i3.p1 TRINITY_DN4628_c0_g1~~TRINITY_DN4628_c0_g1_i3.p1  ORF type:complete len:104 (-),score=11.80 TRINITY_DN4628_c0_g1_i3:98-409(-)
MEQSDFDYFVVLDFEATCENGGGLKPPEIIEFPSVLVKASSLEIVTEFQTFVKPTVNPILTKFCTELTGITQDQVEGGMILPTTLVKYNEWPARSLGSGFARA